MEEVERSQHLETLKATPAALSAALKGVSRALATWRPAPGKWSILEIVCHLRDMERDAYLARYRRILEEENPALPDCDADTYALEGGYRTQKLAEAAREWKALRKETLAVLRKVKKSQWTRPGVHAAAGPLTLEELVRKQAVGNDVAHLAQLEGVKARYALLQRLEALPAAVARAAKAVAKGSAAADALGELRDQELLFAERVQKIAHQSGPALWEPDAERLAARRRERGDDPQDLARDLRQLRADTVVLLRGLPAAAWKRTGRHPQRGEVSIEALAQELAANDERLLARLAR